MMDEKERNESMPREQQSHNIFAKLWRLFTRVLSWLLLLPILFYRQFISPFTPPIVLEEGDIPVRGLLANGQLHLEHRLSPAFLALEAVVLQGILYLSSGFPDGF